MRQQLVVAVFAGLPFSAAVGQVCGEPWGVGSTGPSARWRYAAAYDAGRAKVVLFGGATTAGVALGDTWEWTATGPGGGGSWAQRLAIGPSARISAGAAYDSARQRVVLFGGRVAGSTPSNQTWEWDGAKWRLIQTPASPPAMEGDLLAYDVARQRTVLVSTLSNGLSWEYDGTTWTSAGPAPVASGNAAAAMAYDAARSRMVFVGPQYTTAPQGAVATYERSGSGWSIVEMGTHARFSWTGPQLAFDSVTQKVISIDNSNATGPRGLWSWDGVRWSALSTSGPVSVSGAVPVGDAAGGQLVILGGSPSAGGMTDQVRLYRTGVRSGPSVANFQPGSFLAYLGGDPFTLHANASGSGSLTYRWRLNGIELSDSGPFSGTHTPDLTVVPEDENMSGRYDALVTDSCGTTVRPATQVSVVCYPNCDGSIVPRLNTEDFQCFIDQYAGGGTYANCDGSTSVPMLTANDFMCFLNQVARGCP